MTKLFRPVGTGYGNGGGYGYGGGSGNGYGNGWGTGDGDGWGRGCGTCSPHRSRRIELLNSLNHK